MIRLTHNFDGSILLLLVKSRSIVGATRTIAHHLLCLFRQTGALKETHIVKDETSIPAYNKLKKSVDDKDHM